MITFIDTKMNLYCLAIITIIDYSNFIIIFVLFYYLYMVNYVKFM